MLTGEMYIIGFFFMLWLDRRNSAFIGPVEIPLCYCAAVWDVVAQNRNFACFVWVLNLVSYNEGGTQSENV